MEPEVGGQVVPLPPKKWKNVSNFYQISGDFIHKIKIPYARNYHAKETDRLRNSKMDIDDQCFWMPGKTLQEQLEPSNMLQNELNLSANMCI